MLVVSCLCVSETAAGKVGLRIVCLHSSVVNTFPYAADGTESERKSETERTINICEEVASGHGVNTRGEGGMVGEVTPSLPAPINTYTQTHMHFRTNSKLLAQHTYLKSSRSKASSQKWRYRQEERIKASSEITLLRISASPLLLPSSPLPLPHLLHLQTPASSSAWPQGGRGEADTDVIHSPPV